jgi:CRP/FNR family transcriptional regulator, cyclic AMP receptor protein
MMSKFWGNIFRNHQHQADEIDALLVKIPVFQDLNKREIMMLKRILHQREYRKNEIVFQEGEVGLGMYIIVKGGVKIVCGPGEQVLAELNDGDFFGELSLLNDSPRSASAVTQSPCTMLCFFKPELLDIINRTPKLGCKILFRLAWAIGERLVSTNQQLSELSCAAPEV